MKNLGNEFSSLTRHAVTLLALAGCTLEPYQDGTARVTLSVSPPLLESAGRSYLALPFFTADYDCVAVNVMGSGIASQDSQSYALEKLIAGETCAYPGATSSLLNSNETEASLAIRRGPDRLFQVLGIQSNVGCGAQLAETLAIVRKANANFVSYGNIYEMGRTVATVENDSTVNITLAPNHTGKASLRDCVGSQSLDPRAAGPLKIWLKADHYYNSTDTQSLVGLDWDNEIKDGAGITSIAHTASGVNYLQLGAKNSKPSVFFSSVHNSHRSTLDLGLATELTVFVTAAVTSPSTAALLCLTNGSNCTSGNFFSLSGPSGTFATRVSNGMVIDLSSTVAPPTNQWVIYMAKFKGGAAGMVSLDAWWTGVHHSHTTVPSIEDIDLRGGANYIFVGSGAGNLTGQIGEVLIYDSLLSAANSELVLSYLSRRYNIDTSRGSPVSF